MRLTYHGRDPRGTRRRDPARCSRRPAQRAAIRSANGLTASPVPARATASGSAVPSRPVSSSTSAATPSSPMSTPTRSRRPAGAGTCPRSWTTTSRTGLRGRGTGPLSTAARRVHRFGVGVFGFAGGGRFGCVIIRSDIVVEADRGAWVPAAPVGKDMG
ncbi:hypothetical protein GCM10010302_17400 [Streptomyces polychromogenes]|uniref:Uncharacterized protein n=1 Tax=Streptomyces polychromogenes TaxID=67342 RepID=A0ABN0V802_9ACTN